MSYNDLIIKNIAPLQATKIGVYNSTGSKVGKIELGNLKKTGLGNKLYSFGAISDIHLQYNTAQADFQKALTYFNNNESVAFTCISGDLTANGITSELQVFKNYIEQYSANTPVYACTGNHEGNNSSIESVIESYTGHPLYYSIQKNNDVFIFVGVRANSNGNLFTKAELQWLYETLEENRNKRCFVFEHVRPQDGCGNAAGIYNYDIWGGTEQTVFESLLRHYKNVILFHGHSHLKFYLQYLSDVANYDNIFGIHSIHIPSLAVPRDGDASGASSRVEVYADSEGYVVDVYENAIVLRGRDFVAEKFLPIAQYCLDTTLQNVDANTYTDSTGTIDTSTTYSITNNLANATNSNNATNVTKKGSYTATIVADEGYGLSSITVTMGGVDVTSTVVNGNNINIPSVTGNVVITVTTIADTITYPITNNLTNCTNSNSNTSVAENTSYNATLVTEGLYVLKTVTITMGGIDVTSSCYNKGTISIESVTGAIIITATATEEYDENVILKIESHSYELTGAGKYDSSGYINLSDLPTIDGDLYGQWDGYELSDGNTPETDKISIVLQFWNDSNLKMYTDYISYDEPTLIVSATDSNIKFSDLASSITRLRYQFKASSSSSATFPVTFTINNFRLFTKKAKTS